MKKSLQLSYTFLIILKTKRMNLKVMYLGSKYSNFLRETLLKYYEIHLRYLTWPVESQTQIYLIYHIKMMLFIAFLHVLVLSIFMIFTSLPFFYRIILSVIDRYPSVYRPNWRQRKHKLLYKSRLCYRYTLFYWLSNTLSWVIR